jgi:hypothetical protein
MKGYKPEVTNPQHTKLEIFKGKVKRKCLNLRLGFYFLTNCIYQEPIKPLLDLIRKAGIFDEV